VTASGPKDDKARLGAALRRLREGAGLTGAAAGELLGSGQPRISKIERGALRARPEDVRTLCEIYGAAPDETQALVEIAERLSGEASEPRRVILSRGAAAMQHKIRRLEESAQLLRSFQPCMVIGLLQTEPYARLVFGVSSTGPDVDRAVAARMERQQVLRDHVSQAVLIMTEGALRWQAGSPKVMLEQLEAIAEASALPNVHVGVIPYSTPMQVFPRHGWHLYDSDAVIVGTETGTATIVDGDDIARYEELFKRLEAAAVFGEDARDELARVANDYRTLL
jgi:transcriptional regulator with XRE-family HTH domain